MFHLSEVKGPVMDRLKGTHFLKELTGKVHLTHYDVVASINEDLARQTLNTQRDYKNAAHAGNEKEGNRP